MQALLHCGNSSMHRNCLSCQTPSCAPSGRIFPSFVTSLCTPLAALGGHRFIFYDALTLCSPRKVWKDAIAMKAKAPYMEHDLPSRLVHRTRFRPLQDVLGLGHTEG